MRVPITHPYRKLKNYMLAGNEMSPRKMVCYRFLRWVYSGDRDDKDAFIAELKSWRKIERRIGGHRTVLERHGRKLFKENWKRDRYTNSRKAASEYGKWAAANGIGIHSPENKARNSEHTRARLAKEKAEGKRNNKAKDWIVHSPDGEVFRVVGLRQISAQYGLDHRTLNSTKNKPGKTHKGWWVEPVNTEFEQLDGLPYRTDG